MKHRIRSFQAVAACAVLVPVASVSAAALTPGDILVTTDQSARPADTLYEYTTAGAVKQSVAVPVGTGAATGDQYPRDIAVDPTGKVQIFNGTFTPYLTTYDPTANTFAHHAADFSTVNNVSYGGAATNGRYVFVNDMNTVGSTNVGILRFDTANGYAVTRFRSDQVYSRVSLGADGLLYALGGSAGVDVLDPSSMTLLRSVTLGGDPRAIAATATGDLFVADWGGTVYHLSSTGTQIGSRPLGVGNIEDIDLSPTNQLVVGGRFGDVVLTDTTLAAQTSFKASGTPVFVAFTSPVPEPTSLGLLGLCSVLAMRRRRRGADVSSFGVPLYRFVAILGARIGSRTDHASGVAA